MDIYDSELTAQQIREMLGVIIPTIGFVTLRRTAAIEAAYQRWLQTKCDHDEEPEIGRLLTRNGGLQFYEVCPRCHHRHGPPISHDKVQSKENAKDINGLSDVEFEKKRRDDWRAEQSHFFYLQGGEISQEYPAYLKSPEWRSKRDRVMRRAKGICEGCGEAKATQVHHLTYDHIGEEFLWELVAVCAECHARVHPEKQGRIFGDD